MFERLQQIIAITMCSCRSMGHIHVWCFNEYFVCLCFKFDCFKICIYVSHFLWGYL